MSEMLKVSGLKKYFDVKDEAGEVIQLRAVDDVSFFIQEGETIGLVGESGCGKSTIGKCLVRLYEPTAGEILFRGVNITHLSRREMLAHRKDIQMIFQDPYSSLDPRMNVRALISEGVRIQRPDVARSAMDDLVESLMVSVGLSAEQMLRYPHEFSGGQRQRIAIARALAVEPALIVCDEPVSALDVSVQAQVVNLLQKLKKERNVTYLFISHDLRVVRHLSDRIIVMYLGNIMETARADDLFAQPVHPYTQMLLSAVPNTNPEEKREKLIMNGEIPGIDQIPAGCRFCTRCPYADERCRSERPGMLDLGNGHQVACFREC